MAEAWATLVSRLLRCYTAAGLKCGKGLNPPAEEAVVDNVARRLRVRLPPSLRAVWRVHGGQRYVSPGVTGLFGKHRLHSPSELVGSYRMFRRGWDDLPQPFPPRSGKTVYFHPRLLPFASWDVYNLCFDIETGAVWEFSPNYGTRGGTSRPSLRALVRELLALMRNGRPPEPDFIFVRPRVEQHWLTRDVLGLARGIVADEGLDRLPILADDKEEAHQGSPRKCSKMLENADDSAFFVGGKVDGIPSNPVELTPLYYTESIFPYFPVCCRTFENNFFAGLTLKRQGVRPAALRTAFGGGTSGPSAPMFGSWRCQVVCRPWRAKGGGTPICPGAWMTRGAADAKMILLPGRRAALEESAS